MGLMKTGDVAREYFTGANMLLLAAMGVAAAAQVRFSTNKHLRLVNPNNAIQHKLHSIETHQLMTVENASLVINSQIHKYLFSTFLL